MRQVGWFCGGIVATLLVQGACAIAYEPLGTPDVTVHREMVFKVLAPKGYEDASYVALDCKPNMKKTRLASGRK